MRLSLVLLLMSWFLTKFNLMGAVLITLVGMVIAKILAIARIRTLLGTTGIGVLPWKNLAGILVAAGVAAVPSLLMNANLAVPTLLLLPISGMVYVVCI